MNNPAVQSRPHDRAAAAAAAHNLPQSLRLVDAADYRVSRAGTTPVLTAAHWVLEAITSGQLDIGTSAAPILWKTRMAGTGVLYVAQTHYRERFTGALAAPAPSAMATGVGGVVAVAGVVAACTSVYARFDDTGGLLRQFLRPRAGRFWIEDPERVLQAHIEQILLCLDAGAAGLLSATGSFYHAMAAILSAHIRGDTLLIAPQVHIPRTTAATARTADSASAAASDVASAGGGAPQLVARVHRILRDHLAQPLRLADVADAVGLSESGLAHAYRRVTGRSPMAALRGLRIEAAKIQLVRGDLKLSTIARQTGFADAFHLSRTFKRLVGLSPRDYLYQRRAQTAAELTHRR